MGSSLASSFCSSLFTLGRGRTFHRKATGAPRCRPISGSSGQSAQGCFILREHCWPSPLATRASFKAAASASRTSPGQHHDVQAGLLPGTAGTQRDGTGCVVSTQNLRHSRGHPQTRQRSHVSAERSKERWAPLRLAQLGLLHNMPPFQGLRMPSCQKCLPCPLQDAQEEPMSRTPWETKLQAFSEARDRARSAKTLLWATAANSKQEAIASCQELKHSRQGRCEKCVKRKGL